jgi:streptogramin lyase
MRARAGILKGPDGNVWFGQGDNSDHASIGRITPSGAITYLQVPTPTSLPDTGVGTVGLDGSVWFGGNGSLGRISPTGSATVYSNAPGDGPMTTAAVGAVWFLEGGATIGRVASNGMITSFDLAPGRTQYGGSHVERRSMGDDVLLARHHRADDPALRLIRSSRAHKARR